jgi:isoquinoline 1-oxidoreductase subunit beta
MEPMNCTALMREDGVMEMWAPTQNPQAGQQGVAQYLGVTPDKVTSTSPAWAAASAGG